MKYIALTVSIIAIVCVFCGLWLFRYQIVPSQYAGSVFVLDRWTGEISVCPELKYGACRELSHL